jgi:hypothetical protein
MGTQTTHQSREPGDERSSHMFAWLERCASACRRSEPTTIGGVSGRQKASRDAIPQEGNGRGR